MPGGRPSRWKAGHVKCQAAVDNVTADLTAEIDKRNARIMYLERLLDRAYIWLHNPYTPQQSAEECARFATLVSEVQLVIQHVLDEDDPAVALVESSGVV